MIKINCFRFSNAINARLFLVTHSYIQNMYYERILHRKQHEDLLKTLQDSGNQIIGAPLFPMDGAYFIFNSKDDYGVKDFIKNDPYIKHKLVSSYEVEEIDQITQLKFERISNLLTFK